MRLNKTERESLRERVKILIPQMKKSEILNHFQKVKNFLIGNFMSFPMVCSYF
jgi:hypothetical protein